MINRLGVFWQTEGGGGSLRCGYNPKKGGLRCGSGQKWGSLPRGSLPMNIPILDINVSAPRERIRAIYYI